MAQSWLLFQRSWVPIPATTWWLTTICNEIWRPLLVCLKTATVYLHIINKSKKNQFFFILFLIICTYMFVWLHVPTEGSDQRCWIPWSCELQASQLWTSQHAFWELGSSVRALSALNCWAISTAPWIISNLHIGVQISDGFCVCVVHMYMQAYMVMLGILFLYHSPAFWFLFSTPVILMSLPVQCWDYRRMHLCGS